MDWKEFEKIKNLRSKLSILGKRVRRKGRGKWEEGIIVVDSFDGCDPEYFIMFSEDDLEQLVCLPFQIWDEEKEKFVDYSDDINILFHLTNEEKEFLNLNGEEREVLKSI